MDDPPLSLDERRTSPHPVVLNSPLVVKKGSNTKPEVTTDGRCPRLGPRPRTPVPDWCPGGPFHGENVRSPYLSLFPVQSDPDQSLHYSPDRDVVLCLQSPCLEPRTGVDPRTH